jgi:hypothetical protein
LTYTILENNQAEDYRNTMIKFAIYLLGMLFCCYGCSKTPEEIEEIVPLVKKPIPIDSCGSLDYFHSMFVINGKCWGQNLLHEAFINSNKRISMEFEVKNKFREIIGLYQYDADEKRVINPKKWLVYFIYAEGDGSLSDYDKKIDLDSTQSLTITINADSTEITGKIKDLNISGGANFHLGFPKEICISEGTFRMRLIK